MMKKLIFAMLFFCSAVVMFAQEEGGGIIYGDNWACIVSAPDG